MLRAPRGRRALLALTATIGLLGATGTAAAATSPPTATLGAAHHTSGYTWRLLPTGSSDEHRGLAAVSRSVAWVSGVKGSVLRTSNGGKTWIDVSVPGASALDFRDISARDARHATVMAAGAGADSRLYVTDDGGAHWRLAYTNHNKQAFFDCMAFFDARHGLLMSDPVGGRFRILATDNGGHSWRVLLSRGMPKAQPGEAGFAASGTCLTTSGHRDAWFGSGGGARSRIYHSSDRGRSWTYSTTPIASSASAGVFSVAFRNRWQGLAVGGDYAKPDVSSANAALSFTGGRWWWPSLAGHTPHGYRSAVAWVPKTPATAIAVGLNGSDVTNDSGISWHRFDTGSFDSTACAPDGACWASGVKGRIARLAR